MKILIDMSLSPEWENILTSAAFEPTHWSRVGRGNAPDREILAWARANDCVVFTHDLDFGTLLAFSRDQKPSVIQLRTQEVAPALMGDLVVSALMEFRELLDQGSLITIDPLKTRARILPL